MKRKEQGITMVALVIIIIVLAVLSGVVVYQGIEIINSAKLQSLSTNLLLVQAKAQAYSEQANFEGNTNALKGTVLADSSVLSKLGLTKNDKIRSLSKEDLNQMGLSKIDADHIYVVDYQTNEVYYTKGYKDDKGNTWYKLSEITKLTGSD